MYKNNYKYQYFLKQKIKTCSGYIHWSSKIFFNLLTLIEKKPDSSYFGSLKNNFQIYRDSIKKSRKMEVKLPKSFVKIEKAVFNHFRYNMLYIDNKAVD